MPDTRTQCSLCTSNGKLDGSVETAFVRCNVREFATEHFTIWRCPHCRSIHSRDVVDLPRYYRNYPFQRQVPNFGMRLITRNYVRRLQSGGLKKRHCVLDYGCGSGMLIGQLRRMGYADVHGFDPYSRDFRDDSVLTRHYDFVILQDVIEHVEDPTKLLEQIIDLTVPGGGICIGTPNAEGIDLARWQTYVHSLHQPYHLHILSENLLRKMAGERGLTVIKFYNTYFADTLLPFVNVRSNLFYANLFDNTIDLAFDPIRFHPRLLSPRGIALGLFGHFMPHRSEMMALFRKDGV
ncbi:MAG: class I SAM-dependent methyltransferase [Planctomycetota bacterium]